MPERLPDWHEIAKRFPAHVNQVRGLFLEVLYRTGTRGRTRKGGAISGVMVALHEEQSASGDEAPQRQMTPCFLPAEEDGGGKPCASMDLLCQYVV